MALVAHISSHGASTFTTSSINTTGATLLVATIAHTFGVAVTISDSKGNVWVPLTGQNPGNIETEESYYVVNPTVGTGHTFTATGTSAAISMCVAAFDTVNAFDKQVGATGSGSTLAGGSLTPTNNNSTLISAASGVTGVAAVSSVDSSYTITDNETGPGGVAVPVALAYFIQTTAAAKNPTWTFSSSVGAKAVTNAVFYTAVITTISVPVASLTTTTYAPAVSIDTPIPAGALALSSFAPAVTLAVTVPVGSLVTATFAPTLNKEVAVPVGSLVITSYVPALTTDNPVPVGSLVLTEYAPVLIVNDPIEIPVGSFAFTTYAPSLVSQINISVPVGTLSLTGLAPAFTLIIPVGVGSLVTATYEPFTDVLNVHVPVAALVLTSYAPSALIPTIIPIPIGALHLSTYVPTVFQGNLGSCAERFGPKLYYWEPSYLLRPEDTFLRATDWENAGHQGMKFVQGIIIEADTEGETRQIKLQGDQADIETITINHNGQIMKPYSLNQPVQKHLLRLLPVDLTAHWRLFNFRWVYEPAPEYAKEWKTQGTDHDIPGYQFLKDGYIAHASTADITLNITVDDNVFTYVIPNSGGAYVKTYILFAIANSGLTLKGSLFTYELTSSQPFQLFQKDCEVRVHAWAGGAYMVKLPFGDVHRTAGARI